MPAKRGNILCFHHGPQPDVLLDSKGDVVIPGLLGVLIPPAGIAREQHAGSAQERVQTPIVEDGVVRNRRLVGRRLIPDQLVEHPESEADGGLAVSEHVPGQPEAGLEQLLGNNEEGLGIVRVSGRYHPVGRVA
jgi:hypothetical protein